MIQRDLKCVKCGYNLRGLSENGKCPECEASITATIQHLRTQMHKPMQWSKILAFALPLLYVAWVMVGVLIGGEQGGYIALMPLWLFGIILELLGVHPSGDIFLSFMF